MPRFARHKGTGACTYHLVNHAAGPSDFHPFKDPVVADQFEWYFDSYQSLYFCERVAHCLMNNHIHSVVHFEEFRFLERQELIRLAQKRYGRRFDYETRNWDDERWLTFNKDLFDVSRFMKDVQGQFSTWFNRRTGRIGPFWADRFKNPEYLDPESIRQIIYYVELNPVRAGLVQRPEQWERSSANWRLNGIKAAFLTPLEELFPAQMGMDSLALYRARLYYYGATSNDESKQVIPEWIIREEESRGFARPGMFLKRQPFFSRGVAIGSHGDVARVLEQYRERGVYKRRKNPIPQLGGKLFSLRAPRSGQQNTGTECPDNGPAKRNPGSDPFTPG